MTIVATEVDGGSEDRWFPCYIKQDQTLQRGRRSFKVNTRDMAAALAAPGLPGAGDPWSAGYDDCVLVGYDPITIGGADTFNGQTEGGWTSVRCIYQSPTGSGTVVPPTEGVVVTNFEVQAQQQTVYYSTPVPGPNEPIRQGDGASKEIGLVVARITTWRDAPASGVDWSRLWDLSRRRPTNDSLVVLSNIEGTGAFALVQAGEARYLGYRSDYDQGKLKIEHAVAIAPDHREYWEKRDDAGNLLLVVGSTIYESENLGGLWP